MNESEQKELISTEGVHPCEMCNRVFTTSQGVLLHKRRAHFGMGQQALSDEERRRRRAVRQKRWQDRIRAKMRAKMRAKGKWQRREPIVHYANEKSVKFCPWCGHDLSAVLEGAN